MSLKEIFKTLDAEQKKQLMYAFEQGISSFIRLPEGKFIGVNLNHVSGLQITETNNTWAIGNVL